MAERKSQAKSTASKRSTAARKTGAKKPATGSTAAAKKAGTKAAPKKATAAKATAKPAAKRSTTRKPAAAKTTPGRARTRPPVNLPPPEAEIVAAATAETAAGATAETKTEPAKPERRQELPTAPSLGPNTVIERESAEERLSRHEQSDVDAMGKDKRRDVVGKTYGPTRARQAALYGIFLALIAAIAIGGKLLADELDQPPETNPDEAPWSASDARQIAPDPLQ